MVFNFLDNKFALHTDRSASASCIKRKIMSNSQLAEELYKPIIRKFEQRKVQPSFEDIIWAAGLAYTQMISKF